VAATPNAAILLTGSELTTGQVRDANGSYLAANLTGLGVRIDEILLVPDDTERLLRALGQSIAGHDIVIVSGGLGPTADDLTVEVLARVLGGEVVRDEASIERMRARFRARGGSEEDLPANYDKQAEVIAGSEVLLNPAGAAPGFVVTTERGVAITLPGVPFELRALYEREVVPALRRRFALEPRRRLIGRILGHGESWAETRIQGLGLDGTRIEYGISAKPGELVIRFSARTDDDDDYIDDVRLALEQAFGADLVLVPESRIDASGESLDREHVRLVHELLIERGQTVATAESCSGGLIAASLTDTPGSSAYFLGAVVAYQDEVKARDLEIDTELIATHGAVSEPVCRAMAANVRRRFGADLAIATTGIAGPAGERPGKPVGLVYVGIAHKDGTVDVEERRFWGDRANVRRLTTVRALDLLRRALI